MKQLEGKIAVVTGGTQGLGASIATLFAERGASGIVTLGRNREKGEAVARTIAGQTGSTVHFVGTDLGRVEDCRNAVSVAKDRFGRIDILVNAAGVTDRGTVLDTSQERFDDVFNVNARAPFFLIQDTVKIMIETGTQGAIVNIGSTSALAGQPFISAYCASKAALATITRNTAFALLRNKIRVNQLNIGWMASDGEDRIQREFHNADDDWLEKAAAEQPNGRLLDPNEVARAVAFLASEESGMMTGSVINFDQSVWGGYSAAPPTPEGPLLLDEPV